ncbi:MAG: hypothetical protein IJ877_00495 [Candidatus Gastranaerophilales bacterium]|nr:hypothetical protein [Candidatus Gastranaerophilales bacterium]
METSIVTVNVRKTAPNKYRLTGNSRTPQHLKQKEPKKDILELSNKKYTPKHLSPSKRKSKTNLATIPVILAAVLGMGKLSADSIRVLAPSYEAPSSYVETNPETTPFQEEQVTIPEYDTTFEIPVSTQSPSRQDYSSAAEDIEETDFEGASNNQVISVRESIVLSSPSPKMQEAQEMQETEATQEAQEAEETEEKTTEQPFQIELDDTMQYCVDKFLERYNRNINRYKYVEAKTGVAAELIGAIHFREGSNDFSTCLHNGAPLGTEVDGNIYYSWEDSAIAAINKIKKLYVPTYGDIETYYNFAEQYNGTGYRIYHNINSPYVWSGTDKYETGMYISDGSFDLYSKDTRPGVAVLLNALGLS